MTIRFSPISRSDLEEIHDYIAADKPFAAEEFINRLERACKRLGEYPRIGQECEEIRPGLRMVTEGNYLILFRVSGDVVEILRVLHGSRDWRRLI